MQPATQEFVEPFYWYRHTIETDDPIVRAAFRVADMAHAGRLRGKHPSVTVNGEQVKYISHPIMCYDMALLGGVTDSITLATLLLHDTLEQDKFERRADLLRRALEKELMIEFKLEEVTPELQSIAHKITARVGQVTNIEHPQSKRMGQIKRVHDVGRDAKFAKTLDQLANVMDNLIAPNNEKYAKKAPKFAYKARDVVKGIWKASEGEDREFLRPWHNFFVEIWKRNIELIRNEENAKQLRANFQRDLPGILLMEHPADLHETRQDKEIISLPFPKTRPTEKELAEFADHHDMFGDPRFGGIVQVDIDAEGAVVGFMTWCANAPGDTPKHPRNRMQEVLVSWLEHEGYPINSDHQLRPVTLANGEVVEEGCYYQLEKKMNYHDFANAALYTDCLGHAEISRFKQWANETVADWAISSVRTR